MANTFLLPRADLLPDQLSAVEAPISTHRIVFGAPGSGKTQVLIHRADHLSKSLGLSADRYRVFVFTNVLKDFIRSSLTMLDLPLESVSTFDHWCLETYKQFISPRIPWDYEGKHPDHNAIRSEVLKAVQVDRRLKGSLEFALVDEGQDLNRTAFEILRNVAKHVTVFADPQQRIFENGSTEADILKTLGLIRRNSTLLAAYRNSPDVAKVASYFVSDDVARDNYLRQGKNTQSVRERPLLFLAATLEEEMDRLAEVVRQRMVMNQSACIIVPQVRQVYGLAKGLLQRNVSVDKAGAQRGKNNEAAVRFDTMTPKIATYHSAKGLTFDCVLLPRLQEGSFPLVAGEARRRLLFVGITRATQWVYMSALTSGGISELSVLEKPADKSELTIHRSEQPASQSGFSFDEPDAEEEEFSVL